MGVSGWVAFQAGEQQGQRPRVGLWLHKEVRKQRGLVEAEGRKQVVEQTGTNLLGLPRSRHSILVYTATSWD